MAGSRSPGISGSPNGNRRHFVDQRDQRGERRLLVVGRGAKGGDELSVAGGDRIQIPRPPQQLLGLEQRADLGAENDRCVDEPEVAQDGIGRGLPVDVGRHGHAGAEESEPGEPELAPELVAATPRCRSGTGEWTTSQCRSQAPWSRPNR